MMLRSKLRIGSSECRDEEVNQRKKEVFKLYVFVRSSSVGGRLEYKKACVTENGLNNVPRIRSLS